LEGNDSQFEGEGKGSSKTQQVISWYKFLKQIFHH
jgi:hypothetical protein